MDGEEGFTPSTRNVEGELFHQKLTCCVLGSGRGVDMFFSCYRKSSWKQVLPLLHEGP